MLRMPPEFAVDWCVACADWLRPTQRPFGGQWKSNVNGEPLDGGSIQFTSLGEKKMNGGAMVNGGAYSIAQEKGLLPGTYHVEINAPDNAAKPIVYRSSPDSPGVVTQPDRVPPEYNVNSKKTIEVAPAGDNRFDFDIQGKPSK